MSKNNKFAWFKGFKLVNLKKNKKKTGSSNNVGKKKKKFQVPVPENMKMYRYLCWKIRKCSGTCV